MQLWETKNNGNDMATNREWAMKMIPVLVRWAQATWDKPHYYSNLTAAVGHKTNQIGAVMATIQDIIDELKETSGREDIPTLNCLVLSKNTDLPSDGFDYVIPNYSKLSQDSKRGEVRKLNYAAHMYDWGWVLKELGLKPATVTTADRIEKIKKSVYGSGGEGKEHNALKEYIAKHPERIGIRGDKFAKTEHDLLSGDRLDVYFECKKKQHFAIEVKPKSSPEGDLLRGVYQCVKYKAVMDAMRVVDNDNYENSSILVIAGEMTDTVRQVANDLNVRYIESFRYMII